MATVEKSAMKHSHFRLKVDLSRFFQDARRFCWIFVDRTKIQQIIHIKQHINELFSIPEPFHLVLNDNEYLPPVEDVRVLQENETVLVVPGSGIDVVSANEKTNNGSLFNKQAQATSLKVIAQDISNDTFNSINPSTLINSTARDTTFYNAPEYLPSIEDVRVLRKNETVLVVPGSGIDVVSANEKTSNGSLFNKQTQTTNLKVIAQDISNDTFNSINSSTLINSTTKDTTFYNALSDTIIDHDEGGTNSKTTDNNSTEDCNIIDSIVSVAKRKRVRKRRPRNQSQLVEPSNTNEQSATKEEVKSKKPKIIDSYIIPSGKHIRFDNVEANENKIEKQVIQKVSKDESCINESFSQDLSTLLALGQSSTPMTFANRKSKSEIKKENRSSDEIKGKDLTETIEKHSMEKNTNKESKQNYEVLRMEDFPVMTKKPQVNDTVAFKTLKIGADYTPQMSNPIFAKVLSSCLQSGNYTLQILSGKTEVQVPFGKFSLSEEEFESQPDGDTFILNYSQMIQPRLIS